MDNYIFIDPSTQRKKKDVKDKLRFVDGIPVFSILEFSIHGTCTRRCPFCPISNPEYKKTRDHLDVNLYRKIIKDLLDIEYDGKILFSGFSEPLLHKNIEELARITKTALPNCVLEIVSNGDLFTPEKVKGLLSSGIDTVNVSLYDSPKQLEEMQTFMKTYGFTEKQMVLRRRYFDGKNYGITVSNRTGLVDSNKFRDLNEQPVSELPLKSACYYPFYCVMVHYTGEVLLCPHDWKMLSKVGNLAHSHIWELWQNRFMNFAREKLAAADRGFAPCNTCDVKGDVIGRESFDAWIKTGKTN